MPASPAAEQVVEVGDSVEMDAARHGERAGDPCATPKHVVDRAPSQTRVAGGPAAPPLPTPTITDRPLLDGYGRRRVTCGGAERDRRSVVTYDPPPARMHAFMSSPAKRPPSSRARSVAPLARRRPRGRRGPRRAELRPEGRGFRSSRSRRRDAAASRSPGCSEVTCCWRSRSRHDAPTATRSSSVTRRQGRSTTTRCSPGPRGLEDRRARADRPARRAAYRRAR